MNIKSYGYSKFKNTTKLMFAVIVPWNYKDHVVWQYVTDIESYPHHVWRGENHKKAFLWNNRKQAQDFVIQLAYRNFAGYVVEVIEGMEPSNNYLESEKKEESNA